MPLSTIRGTTPPVINQQDLKVQGQTEVKSPLVKTLSGVSSFKGMAPMDAGFPAEALASVTGASTDRMTELLSHVGPNETAPNELTGSQSAGQESAAELGLSTSVPVAEWEKPAAPVAFDQRLAALKRSFEQESGVPDSLVKADPENASPALDVDNIDGAYLQARFDKLRGSAGQDPLDVDEQLLALDKKVTSIIGDGLDAFYGDQLAEDAQFLALDKALAEKAGPDGLDDFVGDLQAKPINTAARDRFLGATSGAVANTSPAPSTPGENKSFVRLFREDALAFLFAAGSESQKTTVSDMYAKSDNSYAQLNIAQFAEVFKASCDKVNADGNATREQKDVSLSTLKSVAKNYLALIGKEGLAEKSAFGAFYSGHKTRYNGRLALETQLIKLSGANQPEGRSALGQEVLKQSVYPAIRSLIQQQLAGKIGSSIEQLSAEMIDRQAQKALDKIQARIETHASDCGASITGMALYLELIALTPEFLRKFEHGEKSAAAGTAAAPHEEPTTPAAPATLSGPAPTPTPASTPAAQPGIPTTPIAGAGEAGGRQFVINGNITIDNSFHYVDNRVNFNPGADEGSILDDDDYDDVESVGSPEDSDDAMPFEGDVDPAPGVPVLPSQTTFLAPEPAGEYEGEVGEASIPYASLPSSFSTRPKDPLESIISPVSFSSAAGRPSQTATGFTSILEKFRQAANESPPLMALTPLKQHMRAAPWKRNSDGGWQNRVPEKFVETTWNRQLQGRNTGELAHNPAQFTTAGESPPAAFSEVLTAQQQDDIDEQTALRAELLEGNRQATPVMGDILAD